MTKKSQPVVKVDRDLEDLLPLFMDNRRKDIDRLRDSLSKSDFASLASIGHEIKGTGSGYGFPELSDLGARIELAAAAKQADKVKAVIDEFASFIDTVQIVFID